MHFSLLCMIASCTALIAAAPTGHNNVIRLQKDEVLLYGEGGRRHIMKRSEYEQHQALDPIPPSPPIDKSLPRLVGGVFFPGSGDAATNHTALAKRDAFDELVIIEDKVTRTKEWDLLLSQVVDPGPRNNGRITSSMGRSVSNTISGGGGFDIGKLSKILSLSVNVEYSKSTSSDQSVSIMLEVDKGLFSIMVTNPYKYTRTGYIWRGIVGESERGAGSVTPFYASEFKTGKTNYKTGSMDWVMGEVGVASANTDDIPCRIGNCKALDRVDVGSPSGK